MTNLILILFIAGVFTILLPCILPLIPIVLGVSIAGRSRWRPLLTILGMVISFVGFTFLLLVVLKNFVELDTILRTSTYYILLLFGVGFLIHNKPLQMIGAILGALFFMRWGPVGIVIAAVAGMIAMLIGGRVASAIQNAGATLQGKACEDLGEDNPLTPFIMGLTMGLVWVPCAGPALGFAFALVRDRPGVEALLLLLAYGLGTALPLLIVGYGGQWAVTSIRSLNRWSGVIKQIAGALLIATAILLHLNLFTDLQVWFTERTPFGTIGTDIEERLFGNRLGLTQTPSLTQNSMNSSKLPRITQAPAFAGLGPWHNSDPLTLEELRGKVVLIDFWTYSCINCIRTLPHIQALWEKYNDEPFVILGVHSPEFVFEKDEKNVADAIKKHGLTYPVPQDNDFGTWRAFSNRYWPAKYLIDAEGYIRYTHFGEGAYDETDEAVQSLLMEIGALDTMEDVAPVKRSVRRDQTPETYMGERSWPSLVNGMTMPTDKVVAYTNPDDLPLHKYALGGEWQLMDRERQVLRSENGTIHLHFLGAEVNLVMGIEDGSSPATVTVLVNGEETKTFTVDHDDLYTLYDDAYGEFDLVLQIEGQGLEGYAFTFGS